MCLISLGPRLYPAYPVTDTACELFYLLKSFTAASMWPSSEFKCNWNKKVTSLFFFQIPWSLERIFHFHSSTYPVSSALSFLLGLTSSLSLPVQTHEVPCATCRIIKYHVFSIKCHNSHITCVLTLWIQMAKYKKEEPC